MNHTKRSGFIMILTLMIISMIMILVTRLYEQSRIHAALVHTLINREKAKMLALSGVQLALSQLSVEQEKAEQKNELALQKEKVKDATKQIDTIEKRFLEHVLPALNRWQQFKLSKEHDGIDGLIKITISCENGKININQLFDFAKKKFKGEGQLSGNMKNFVQLITKHLVELTGQKDLFFPLLDFLSKRGYQLNEVSELLAIKEFDIFKDRIFYQPPEKTEKKQQVYLADIFTIWSDSMKIEPWLLSDSVCTLFGLKGVHGGDVAAREQQVVQWVKNFKTQQRWPDDWNKTFKGVYGKDFAALPKGVDNLLNTKFEPTVFSVVSYGTTAKVTQRVYALVKRERRKKGFFFKVNKLYWI